MLPTYGLVLLGVFVTVAVIIIVRARGKRDEQAVVHRRRDEVAERPRAPERPNVVPSDSLMSAGPVAARTISTERARFGDLEWALSLLGKVAAELSALHAQGIVHGGLMSTSVSVEGEDGFENVTLAPARGARDGLGAAHYDAPENVGATNPTTASDVFAFGVLAYEMITARYPWATPPSQHSASSGPLAEAAYPPSVALDPTLRTILTRALSLPSAERPAASELAWLLATPASSSFMTSRGRGSAVR